MSLSTISRRGMLMLTTSLAAASLLPRVAFADEAPTGGRLVVAADSEPRNLNPAIVASNSVFYISSKVVEPLAEASFDGLSPRLATSWEGSADGSTVTFKLREGVTWHDGKPFTSADVAFSAMEVWKPLQNIGRSVLANLERVETPDESTAVFHFSKPMPIQLMRNALPVVTAVLPKHVYEETEIAENPANTHPIGTGPFTFEEHRPGEYYRLAKNESYWGEGEPKLDEIIFRVLPDRAGAASALEAGEIQLAAFSQVPLVELSRMESVPGLEVVTKGYEDLTYQLIVEINHRNETLADLKVRQAIAHAIDKAFVVDTVFLGYATAATGPVPESAKEFYNPDTPSYDFDVDKANALLDEAGYPKKDDGTRFSVRLLPAPFFSETRAFGQYLRQALAAIGIDAELVNNDTPAHLNAVYKEHDFDLAIGAAVFRGDPAISTTNLVKSGIPDGVFFSNQGGYANDKIDALIDEALETVDTEKRTKLYDQFQVLVVEDLPLINVANWRFTSVASTDVVNMANNPRWVVSNWADTGLKQ
ncbi:ABC transporter substrate-binding protein [Amorphus orientalis]|uniref:Peptide/nickel transport system substrate-binding protein n=1 Tax=Amorphus orientalis TaxID=649198 RepID=A0AAE4ATK9_9HYPH|nr:ABC transporter substrate-binding protein [Amorphus orientalis]MDQ0317396.1 peptide/nickel transport system substrate-binding protein [Amorphus orientalis]